MSTSSPTMELPSAVTSSAGEPRRSHVDLRFFRSELRLVLGRRRNIALVGVLSCFPILIGTAVRLSPASNGDGPPFLSDITDNGLFLVFASLTVLLPFFLPLAVSVASGESIAGEANIGTLRNLLVVPVSRTRLLLVKYAASVVFAFVCVATVALVAVIVGLLLFPHGDVTLLSGTTVSYPQALWRALLVLLYVTLMLAGVCAVGIFISTLTEVPIGAMAATAMLMIVSEIADNIPQIAPIHPYLLSHPWLNFGDLLRSPISWHGLQSGVLTQLAYLAIFLPLAWARLQTKDITS
ncbi:MAG: type transport system permease protein [Actinomycetota bacterium]|jgi:ABC-2 type transport system permease protein|nr:type transport system permease protein [Actinomycetota bacterium]MDQ1640688.1 type transport system permease protein [Actinomycetota bacterium]